MERKKKGGRRNGNGLRIPPLSGKGKDLSKFARATSTKSEFNYAELSARSGSSRPRASDSAKDSRHPQAARSSDRVTPGRSRTGRKKPVRNTADRPSKGKSAAGFAPLLSALTAGAGKKSRSAGQKNRVKSAPSGKTAGTTPSRTQPEQQTELERYKAELERYDAPAEEAAPERDRFSEALDSQDYYSSPQGIYNLKHPERAVRPDGRSRKKRAKSKKTPPANPSQPSVAELAKKNRGTQSKKKHAAVVRTGRATGVLRPRKAAQPKVRRRSRYLRRVINTAVICLAVVTLTVVCANVFFHVKSIVVKGESPYSAAQISSLCGVQIGDNLLFIDAAECEKTITGSLPYIGNCSVRRRFPATVEVNVTNARVVGLADTGGGCWTVVGSDGRVLETLTDREIVSGTDIVAKLSYTPDAHSLQEAAALRHVPVLQGLDIVGADAEGFLPESDIAKVRDLTQIIEEAAASDLRFTALRCGDRGYEAEYEGRVNIVLGEKSDDAQLRVRLKTASYILRQSGKVSSHEQGEITFSKNRTYFTPSYEVGTTGSETKETVRSAEKKETAPSETEPDDSSAEPQTGLTGQEDILHAGRKLLRLGKRYVSRKQAAPVSGSDS